MGAIMIKNNKGIFHWFGYIQPFEERIKLIKQAGFDYCMLWWEDESYPYHISRMEFNKIIEFYDLKLDNIHLPFDNVNNLWCEDKRIRSNEINVIKKWLNECKSCGCDVVVMHNTKGNNHKFNYSLGYDSFEQIIEEANKINIKIALENTQMFEYTDFLFRELQSTNLGFCYDSSHDFVHGGSCGYILEKWKDRLIAVHLSDNDGMYDRHWIPGKGHVDWKKVMHIIKETNIKSYSMETYPYEEEKNLQPSEFLAKAIKALDAKIYELL